MDSDSSYSKKEMTEEDIKYNFITPAIEKAGWLKSDVRMEAKISPGAITLGGNVPKRGKPKKADYLLLWRPNYPIAIVEAKANDKGVSGGIQQAKEYAWRISVPFAFSSNGDGFLEYDFTTGKERFLGLDEFPTKDELVRRYMRIVYETEELAPEAKRVIEQPYYSGQNCNEPRYYQRIAINRTLDAIAGGRRRLMLVMATGTGKTYTAFQIVYRLLKSGLRKKILYLADRNVLVDQSIQQDFSPLAKSVHKVGTGNESKTTLGAYEVYFSLYQQLVGDDGEEEKFRKLFAPDFFDMVIVDECHRGSAKADGCWRKILDYFEGATQLGMTATPKETKYVSNIDYFGDPIYKYSLKQGIEDGFLAPFRVINVKTNIGDGWRPYYGQVDINGDVIEDRVYNNSDYDRNIILLDRTREVAKRITEYLKSTDRMAKTIVFCPTTEAAERMRHELVNLNADMMKENSDYVVRITGDDDYGKAKLKAFISVGEKFPVIATTSKLLTTGVDCKMVKLIVLDDMISSMTEFKQIIGRGTRIREKEGKLNFTVMDFRNVTRLFADPEWDGEVEQVEDFQPGKSSGGGDGGDGGDDGGGEPPWPQPKPIVDRDGCRVTILGEVVSVFDHKGRLMRTENVVDYTRRNLRGEYANLEAFVRNWRENSDHREIREWLAEKGIDIDELKEEQEMEDVDDFDFLCHVAFDQKPLTRRERARKVQGSDFFSRYSGAARETLETLLEVYMNSDVVEIEDQKVLKTPPFEKFGTISKIMNGIFGGKEKYLEAVRALERALYA